MGIGGQGAGDIHKVQRVQVIEVDQMVMHVLGGHHEVADQRGVFGNLDAYGVVHAAGGGQGVHVGAYAAGTLGEMLGVARIAAFQDQFHAAEKLRAAPGVFHQTVFHLHFNTQVAFNSSNGIDYYFSVVIAFRGCHIGFLLGEAVFLTCLGFVGALLVF